MDVFFSKESYVCVLYTPGNIEKKLKRHGIGIYGHSLGHSRAEDLLS